MSFVFKKRATASFQRFYSSMGQINARFATLSESKKMILDKRQPEAILVDQWWSQPAFGIRTELSLPVFNFLTGEEIDSSSITLDKGIFGKPLRRDIVHNVYLHEFNWQRKTTHRTKNVSQISGSGKKPLRQKGSGHARQGNLRAPGRRTGAKAHGPVPRDYTQHLPAKLQLLGLKTILSARLAEGRIRIVEDVELGSHKTTELKRGFNAYTEKTNVLFIHCGELERNFQLAQRNIRYLKTLDVSEIKVTPILKSKFLFLTRSGLQALEESIQEREVAFRRTSKAPVVQEYREKKPEISEEEMVDYKIKSKSLQHYQYLFEKDGEKKE